MRAVAGPGAVAGQSLVHVHSTLQARPGLFHRRDPQSRINGSRGARARPRVAQSADWPSRSQGGQRGRDPRGEQCSPRSGSCLLASGGIEGELVLEPQQ